MELAGVYMEEYVSFMEEYVAAMCFFRSQTASLIIMFTLELKDPGRVYGSPNNISDHGTFRGPTKRCIPKLSCQPVFLQAPI